MVADAILCDEQASDTNFARWLLSKRGAQADLSATFSWQYVRILAHPHPASFAQHLFEAPDPSPRSLVDPPLSSVMRLANERHRMAGFVIWLLLLTPEWIASNTSAARLMPIGANVGDSRRMFAEKNPELMRAREPWRSVASGLNRVCKL